jgi:SAM-dependent methyltransferase
MGHTDRERRRLSLQASMLNPLTDSFLRRAGISAGMHVLELGCGVGEVSLIAARLVGPHGHVHAIDIDAAALDIATARIRSAGHDHVTFELADLMHHQPERTYDAVIGRHILIHTPNAAEVLKRAVRLVHVGGLIAFQEYDFASTPREYPEMPLTFGTIDRLCEFFRRGVPRPNIGTQLFHLMQEAGLPPPECRAEWVMDGGPHSPIYELLAETARTLLPRLEALGITTAAEMDVDTLEHRLREEALAHRGVVSMPPMIGAFARKRQ